MQPHHFVENLQGFKKKSGEICNYNSIMYLTMPFNE